MKTKFRVGEKLRVKNNFWEMKNPTNLEVDDQSKRDMAGKIFTVGHIYNDGDISFIDNGDWSFHASWLEVPSKTIDDLEEGDLIKRKSRSNKYIFNRVFGICGKAVFISCGWDEGENESVCAQDSIYSINELKDNGYTIVQEGIEDQGETIEILGKTYKKGEVENCLAELKEVK